MSTKPSAPALPRPDPRLRLAGRRRIPTALGPVEILRSGTGPALVALHGGMGGCDQSDMLAEAILDDRSAFDVVAMSRAGYLGTPGRKGRSLADEADLVAALLDALGIDRAVVAAVSAGGPTALEFARRHPGRCAGLVLVSCCTGRLDVPAEVAKRLPVMAALARVPLLPRLGGWLQGRNPRAAAARAIRDPAILEATLADPVGGPLLAELQASIYVEMPRRLPGTLADTARFQHLPEQPFPALSAPILIVHGRADTVVPVVHATRLAETQPQADLALIDGAEHVALFSHRRDVQAAVRAFLQRIGAVRTAPSAPV